MHVKHTNIKSLPISGNTTLQRVNRGDEGLRRLEAELAEQERRIENLIKNRIENQEEQMYKEIYEMRTSSAGLESMLQSEMSRSYEKIEEQSMILVEQERRIAMQEQQMEKEIKEMRSILEEQKRRNSKY